MIAASVDWDGLAVIQSRHAPTGSLISLALHDDTLGPFTGGTRLRRYRNPHDGLRDAMELARAMTFKWAVLDAEAGGAKAVLAVTRPLQPDERRALLDHFGSVLRRVGVRFETGVDFGTRPDDIARVITAAGGDPSFARDTNFGLLTALGVRSAMRAAAESRLGTASLSGLRIVVQGAGQVGAALVRLLVADGAEVRVAETREERLGPLLEELGDGARALPPSEALALPCDIVAPCALGGVLSPEAVPSLSCAIVAGAANNQLSHPSVAEQLHQRGVLYVPDFLAGGGAALSHVLSTDGQSPDALHTGMERIGALVAEILADAASRGEVPVRSAERRARERLVAAAERRSRPVRLLQ